MPRSISRSNVTQLWLYNVLSLSKNRWIYLVKSFYSVFKSVFDKIHTTSHWYGEHLILPKSISAMVICRQLYNLYVFDWISLYVMNHTTQTYQAVINYNLRQFSQNYGKIVNHDSVIFEILYLCCRQNPIYAFKSWALRVCLSEGTENDGLE